MNSSNKSFRRHWIVAGCFVTFGLAVGFPYYNIPFFFDYIRDEHSWTQVLITNGAAVSVLLTIWMGPLIIPRASPRALILVGTFLTFLSFQWFGRLSGNEYEYYAAWIVNRAGFFLSGPIPFQIIISNWYVHRRGAAMGVTYVGVAFIGALCNKLSPYLTGMATTPEESPAWLRFLFSTLTWNRGDYTDAIQLLGFLMVITWPIALFVIRDRPEDRGQLPDGSTCDEQARVVAGAGSSTGQASVKSFADLGRRSAFWLLLVGSGLSIGAISSVNFLLKFVLEEQGFADQIERDQVWADASFTYLLSSIMGRVLGGWLADVLPLKYVMLATYAVIATAIPLLFIVTPEHPGNVLVFAIVFGFALGAAYLLIPLMAGLQFGSQSIGKAMSVILPFDTMTQTWTPRFIAGLAARFAGYGQALWAVSGLAALGALAIAILPKHPRNNLRRRTTDVS